MKKFKILGIKYNKKKKTNKIKGKAVIIKIIIKKKRGKL